MLLIYKYIKTKQVHKKLLLKYFLFFFVIFIYFTLIACTPRYGIESQSIDQEISNSIVYPLPQIYFYAKEGQSTKKQSRDYYECYNWSVDQTDFDPSQSPLPKEERIKVVPVPPPCHDTITMSIIGAVMGALIAGPRHAADGAIIGAAGGALAGAASDSSRMQYDRQQEEAYASRNRAVNAQIKRKAFEFQRAMSACLEGRGYIVR